MRPTSLLFYTHGLVDGGAERLWACLATAFKERGYDVRFVQDFEADDNRANLRSDIPLHTLGSNHFRATWRLVKLLKQFKPDIAISSVGGSNTKLLAAIAYSGVPTKAIISYHGYDEWKTGWLSWLTYLSLPILSRAASRTIAVSNGLREELVDRWKSHAPTTITIHNPVFYPGNITPPSAEELASRPPTVLAVGRLVVEKNFTTLIRAMKRVRTPGAKLIILGKGGRRAALEREIKRLNLGDRVSMPGYSREPWSAYETAKVFALSSVTEPFGNVVVEAMAHGLPIVATACSGPLEILQHGRHGRIVSLRDDVQLAQAIDDALADPGNPMDRVKRAADFSFDVRVPAYVAVIDEVLAERRLSPKAGAGELASG
ncbi:MAG: glycosyltransferase [Hyphomicrobiaceae bacterium]|nr:glycosyltransferase [Hyphomicrobiaceae bacterium]